MVPGTTYTLTGAQPPKDTKSMLVDVGTTRVSKALDFTRHSELVEADCDPENIEAALDGIRTPIGKLQVDEGALCYIAGHFHALFAAGACLTFMVRLLLACQ